jgi:membrane-associated protease RseP (regulator of RpoE activity)
MPSWLKQILSYVVSFLVYSWLFNPIASFVLLGAIAFHECGHLYAAKHFGLRTKGFYLIPFMGGAALIADRYKKYSHMAAMVLAGPMSGTVLAIPFFATFVYTGSATFGAIALLMVGLNLFNLIPVAMLDGGQLVESILYSINDKVAAIFLTASYAIGAYVLWQFNPVIGGLVVFFGFGAVLTAWRRIKLKEQGLESLLPPKPWRMNTKQLVATVAAYIGTALVLGSMLFYCMNHSAHVSDLLHPHF